ncbi:ABC transporter permease subunit [Deinococcus humi]|uniref:NitT/TauT family transport system ATP-binding protein n=1 Tax=Deinococcus humi TaxID=662880 RepID=A0A7W8JTS6_9DEIO|nr:ABC transporter permease subunit [Deinococcus humi]MBB5361646.1 NitT/TauT family transport system ATP-binding protein [Deinococcus humi]GGO21111.1 ABC transporter ATP-binding protein [Deinococcus humi]
MSAPFTELPPAPPADAPIVLEDVSVRLGSELILNGVTMDVRRGEFLALIGPSGGGKSTILRVIAGLLEPLSGVVRVGTAPALVFQDYRLLPWRTALRNVTLPADLGAGGGLPPEEALHLVGMDAYAGYFPAHLSGGMRARVALARALAQSGDVLLLDEPFAALDALVRERFNAELRHLHEKTGRTTVLVTHSIREAVWLADRVAVLRNGRIVEILDTRGEGRVSAYTDGLEAHLRGVLGTGDSTRLRTPVRERLSLSGLLPLAAMALGLLVWQVAAARLNQPFLLPTPAAVWRELTGTFPELLAAFWVTARTALSGLLIGGLLGVLIGYPLAKIRPLERFFSPFIIASQSTPIVILAPLLVSWLGFGFLPAVTISAISALYPIMVSTIIGVREVDRTFYELFRSLRATPLQRLTRLELPGALPVMLGGLRLSASLALIGAVVWEFVDANQKGLGFAIQLAGNYARKDTQFAAIALLILFGVLIYAVITWLERVVMRRRGR